MKLKVAALVLVGTVTAVAAGAGIGQVVSALNEPNPVCIEVLRKLANEAEEKMVMPNADGGLVLMTPGINPSDVRFTSYVGPKTAPKIQEMLVNSGLQNVVVTVGETCETESGLLYTLVRGSYTMPEEKPDPI